MSFICFSCHFACVFIRHKMINGNSSVVWDGLMALYLCQSGNVPHRVMVVVLVVALVSHG